MSINLVNSCRLRFVPLNHAHIMGLDTKQKVPDKGCLNADSDTEHEAKIVPFIESEDVLVRLS